MSVSHRKHRPATGKTVNLDAPAPLADDEQRQKLIENLIAENDQLKRRFRQLVKVVTQDRADFEAIINDARAENDGLRKNYYRTFDQLIEATQALQAGQENAE